MTHGSLEADKHYDPDVFTGIQAYNQGLQYIVDLLGDSIFINLSIAPLFPANYAHCRRIACDAYTDSEYTLNSLTYGWWLDRVYSYNDADNIVFKDKSIYEGTNRSRVVCSAITGIFCIGDDFSNAGNEDAKTKAKKFLTNKEINNLARQTKAFRPMKSAVGDKAADMFYSSVADTTYVAIFNTSAQTKSYEIHFPALKLQTGTVYTVHELWSNEIYEKTDSWAEPVARLDVNVLKIYPKNITGIDTAEENPEFRFYPNPCIDNLSIESKEAIKNISIYSMTGLKIVQVDKPSETISLSHLDPGAYLITAEFLSGAKYTTKLIKANSSF
jgi:alpha-galactosidase